MKKIINCILIVMICWASNVLSQNANHRPSHGSETLTCRATGNNIKYCNVPNLSGVQLTQEISNRNQCRGNWGYASNGIWVRGGCHARFSYTRYTSNSSNNHSSGYPSSGKPNHSNNNYVSTGEKFKIKCKSRNNQTVICDTKGAFRDVKLTREISKGKYPCHRNWGVNKRGQLFVKKNCYGEFTVYK